MILGKEYTGVLYYSCSIYVSLTHKQCMGVLIYDYVIMEKTCFHMGYLDTAWLVEG